MSARAGARRVVFETPIDAARIPFCDDTYLNVDVACYDVDLKRNLPNVPIRFDSPKRSINPTIGLPFNVSE